MGNEPIEGSNSRSLMKKGLIIKNKRIKSIVTWHCEKCKSLKGRKCLNERSKEEVWEILGPLN